MQIAALITVFTIFQRGLFHFFTKLTKEAGLRVKAAAKADLCRRSVPF